ncbi:MAG: stalk domain-containing protein [Peptococcaceae bacterium]|jgi:hypothetical protein|nr:copper amine oxidase N-terminal domain-containing protein [Peptococcaceae bacterium]MDH7525747.1 stalk domain-containing protein [Peptococcaceae bacterium]
MQLIGSSKYQDIFRQYALEPMERIIPNIQDILQAWTVYLGYNPNPGVVNGSNPHTDPNRKYVYIPMVDVLPESDRDLIAQVDIWAHEAGHCLHLELLGDDLSKWQEWARETGHALDLAGRYGGGAGLAADTNYWWIPSYEDFACDIAKMVKSAEPHPYYMCLCGLQYQVLVPGSLEYNVNGVLVDKDAAPRIIEGRTYTPTRHTHEGFGDTVNYINGKIIIVRRG